AGRQFPASSAERRLGGRPLPQRLSSRRADGVTFYGPDVDASHSGNFEGLRGQQSALESTVSAVMDPTELENLPLSGRDVYTLLFTLPGVTSDGGVSRGLGLSVNGQRPSSSNFLLDGVENNNYLVT